MFFLKLTMCDLLICPSTSSKGLGLVTLVCFPSWLSNRLGQFVLSGQNYILFDTQLSWILLSKRSPRIIVLVFKLDTISFLKLIFLILLTFPFPSLRERNSISSTCDCFLKVPSTIRKPSNFSLWASIQADVCPGKCYLYHRRPMDISSTPNFSNTIILILICTCQPLPLFKIALSWLNKTLLTLFYWLNDLHDLY